MKHLLCLVAAIGCWGQAALANDEVQLGLVLPLSGSRASIGQDARNGAELADSELKAEGGTCSLNLKFEDSAGEPAKGVSAFQSLASQDIRFIITQNSNISMATSGIANTRQIIQLAISTTVDRYSTPDDFTFRTNGSTLYEAKTLAEFVKSHAGASSRKVALLTMADEYPTTLHAKLLPMLQESALDVVFDKDFLPAETDYRSFASRIGLLKPDFVFCLGYQTQCGLFVKQLSQSEYHPRFILVNTPVNNREFFEMARESAEGIRVSYIKVNSQHPAASKFKEKYGHAPNLFSANAYDAVLLAGKAFSACHCHPDVSCLRKALASIRDYEGLSGKKSFDPVTGDMQDEYEMLIARNGAFQREDE